MAYQSPLSGYRSPASILKMLMKLAQESNKGYDEARQANETRYQDILKLFGDTRGRVLDNLKDVGQVRVNDINTDFDKLGKQVITDLANRGLATGTGTSSQRGPLLANNELQKQRALSDQIEKMRAGMADVDSGFTDRAAGVMERRDDPYPENNKSMEMIMQLAGLLGGQGGGLEGLLGGGGGLFSGGGSGGGSTVLRSAPNSYVVSEPDPRAAFNEMRAMDDQGYSNQQRRNWEAELYNSSAPGGIGSARRQHELLTQGIQQGYGNVGFKETPVIETPPTTRATYGYEDDGSYRGVPMYGGDSWVGPPPTQGNVAGGQPLKPLTTKEIALGNEARKAKRERINAWAKSEHQRRLQRSVNDMITSLQPLYGG